MPPLLFARPGCCLRVLSAAALVCAAFASPAMAQRGGGITLGGGSEDDARAAAAAQEKASRYFEQGQTLMSKGDVARAKSKFKAAIGLVGLDGVGQSAWNQLVAIHNEGMQHLEQAQTLFKDAKYVEAIELARRTMSIYANIFSGLKVPSNLPNVSRQAKALLKQMEAHPEAQIALQEHDAQKRMKKVQSLEKRAKRDASRYYDLYKAHMKIAKLYPDCPTGKASAAEAARLKADKKISKAIKRERQRRDLAAALSRIAELERNGRAAEAQHALDALMKKHPGKSRDDLERMAKKNKPAEDKPPSKKS